MSDLVLQLRRVQAWAKVWDPDEGHLLGNAADRIEALEVEVELNQRHITALQEAAVTRETWLKNTEAEVERLYHLLKDANHRAEETTVKHLNTEGRRRARPARQRGGHHAGHRREEQVKWKAWRFFAAAFIVWALYFLLMPAPKGAW